MTFDPQRCARGADKISNTWRRAIPALALGLTAALVTTQPAMANDGHDRGNQRSSTAHLLAFNDFHGNIDPPSGSSGLVNGVPAGGAEYLGGWIEQLRSAAHKQTRDVYTVAAGDLIGASPLLSAAFHDQPTVEIMNAIGLDVTAVGNHELDEGVDELLRIQRGGCHPKDGCAAGTRYDGARFQYLSANIVSKRTGRPIVAPTQIRTVGGVPVAFVGMTLHDAATIVNPFGIATVAFRDEVVVANEVADRLDHVGVHAMVLLLHQGGQQANSANPSGCDGFTGDITGIVSGLRPEYGVVVSGHTHRSYVCQLPNASGATSLVTSAGSAGTLITDITVGVDRRTRRFTSATATNVTVANGVRNADGTWAKDAAGGYLRDTSMVDKRVKQIADRYRTVLAPVANRVVGTIAGDISNQAVASGESPLGDVIADGQLAYTRAGAGAQIALMNPGGIRAPLTYAPSAAGEAPGEVTYGEAFTVQPFNNLLVTQSLTGAQIKEVLEQQFSGYSGQRSTQILQVSAGLSYQYDPDAAAGSRIQDLRLDGVALDPQATYRVTTNDYLAAGGDGFTGLKAGTDRATAAGFDVDAFIAYLGTGPIQPGRADRIKRSAG